MTPSEIKTLRLALCMTQRQFAEAIGLSSKGGNVQIYRYERGERTPSGTAVKMMQELKKSLLA